MVCELQQNNPYLQSQHVIGLEILGMCQPIAGQHYSKFLNIPHGLPWHSPPTMCLGRLTAFDLTFHDEIRRSLSEQY